MKTRKRHIAKTITWRILASTTTFILTLVFFKESPDATSKALGVVALESVIKMILYYYHERLWFIRQFGLRSSVRHLLKTITWRAIASASTFVIAFLIFKDDPFALEKASGIAVVETIIKMILYFLHERIWYRQDLGLDRRKENNEQIAIKIDEK
ncbi:MAG: DUF2061 domain-containing protein [Cyclobacteriaceae bacterium]